MLIFSCEFSAKLVFETGIEGSTPEIVTEFTRQKMHEHRLYRCLSCDAVAEFTVDGDALKRGGHLYSTALRNHGPLKTGFHYERLSGESCYQILSDMSE